MTSRLCSAFSVNSKPKCSSLTVQESWCTCLMVQISRETLCCLRQYPNPRPSDFKASAPPAELPEQHSCLSLVPSFTSKLNSPSSTAINKAQKCSSTNYDLQTQLCTIMSIGIRPPAWAVSSDRDIQLSLQSPSHQPDLHSTSFSSPDVQPYTIAFMSCWTFHITHTAT